MSTDASLTSHPSSRPLIAPMGQTRCCLPTRSLKRSLPCYASPFFVAAFSVSRITGYEKVDTVFGTAAFICSLRFDALPSTETYLTDRRCSGNA